MFRGERGSRPALRAGCSRLALGRLLGALGCREARGVALAAVVAAVLACGGDTGTGPNGSGGGGNDTSLQVSAGELDSLAGALYAQVVAGQDVTSQVATVLGAMMPIVADGQTAYADSLIATGTPMLLPAQPAQVAAALTAGETVSVANFVAAADSAGAKLAGSSQPLTEDELTAVMASATRDSVYGVDDILPAVVLALGRARARATGAPITDAVWSDGQLDPLQTLLLLYAIDYAGADHAAAADRADPRVAADIAASPDAPALGEETLAGWIAGKAKEKAGEMVTGKVGEEIEFPLGKKDAAEASVCASVLLYSYKFSVTASPTALWHHDPNQPTHPWKSLVTAKLVFDFVPNEIGSHVLELIECPVPDAGAAPGRNVGWSLDDSLKAHGSFDLQQTVTDDNGEAVATYATIPEMVPTQFQLAMPKLTGGSVGIVATGLLPGKWANLEKGVGLGVWSPTESGVELHVQYYEMPKGIEVQIHSRLDGTGPADAWYGVADADLQAAAGTPPALFAGAGPATYESFYYRSNSDSCALESTGTENGQFTLEVSANASRPGGVSSIFGLGSPSPVEDYQVVCNGQTTTSKGSRFWGFFFVMHADSLLSGIKPVELGHGQRTYSDTWSESGFSVTEHTTVDVYLTTQ